VVAVLAETPAGRETAMRLLDQLGVRTAEWEAVRARILAAATVMKPAAPPAAQVVVALLMVEQGAPSGEWLFEAGLALGALAGRAIVVQLGDSSPPAELRDLGVIRVDPERPATLHALSERLRQAAGGV